MSLKLFGLSLALMVSAGTLSGALGETKEVWSVKGFMHPESVYEDAARHVLYVSNINGAPTDKDGNGFISKVGMDGKLVALKWIEGGLNAPKGMVMKGDTLWVTDIDKLVEIDAAAGKIVNTYPAQGAVFLNDPAVDEDGAVYVSDIATRKIWQLKDGKMAVWYEKDDLQHPNGLRIDGGKLIVAGWGTGMKDDGSTDKPGNLLTIDLKTKELANLGGGQGVGNLDGLEKDAKGDYLATDFMAGALYRIRADGTYDKLLALKQGSADLELLDDNKTVVIPEMMEDAIAAYKVEE
jgi:sugar lactone lactonase YvrE